MDTNDNQAANQSLFLDEWCNEVRSSWPSVVFEVDQDAVIATITGNIKVGLWCSSGHELVLPSTLIIDLEEIL